VGGCFIAVCIQRRHVVVSSSRWRGVFDDGVVLVAVPFTSSMNFNNPRPSNQSMNMNTHSHLPPYSSACNLSVLPISASDKSKVSERL
jgi:hypothetical protein